MTQAYQTLCTASDRAGQQNLSVTKRLVRFGIALALLWFVIYVLAPVPVSRLGPMRDYARIVDKVGVQPGALYYSDVPVTVDAEINNRSTVRYFGAKPSGTE